MVSGRQGRHFLQRPLLNSFVGLQILTSMISSRHLNSKSFLDLQHFQALVSGILSDDTQDFSAAGKRSPTDYFNKFFHKLKQRVRKRARPSVVAPVSVESTSPPLDALFQHLRHRDDEFTEALREVSLRSGLNHLHRFLHHRQRGYKNTPRRAAAPTPARWSARRPQLSRETEALGHRALVAAATPTQLQKSKAQVHQQTLPRSEALGNRRPGQRHTPRRAPGE